MGGISMILGASTGRLTAWFGDCGGVRKREDRSGHDWGDWGEARLLPAV